MALVMVMHKMLENGIGWRPTKQDINLPHSKQPPYFKIISHKIAHPHLPMRAINEWWMQALVTSSVAKPTLKVVPAGGNRFIGGPHQ